MITSAPFMSCPEDRDLAEVVIDSLRFAAEGGYLSGKLALSQLPRLSDVLTSQAGSLVCVLAGFREPDAGKAKLGLRLQVSGRLSLRCERCLSDVDVDCAIDSRLMLIPPGEAWPEEELETDDYDAIPANRELSLLSLVEEEVLLALPIVPRHAHCQPPSGTGDEDVERRPSPFAALAGLKKS